MTRAPRIALFSDSHHEANGVARTASAIEACVQRRGIQMLSVHAGPATRMNREGSILHFDLPRAKMTSISLEHDARFDPMMWRHAPRVAKVLKEFAPDVLHFTGPGDIGQLGVFLGRRLGIPMVGAWHANLHERMSRRLRLKWASDTMRARAKSWVQDQALHWLMQFYKIPHAIMAPDDESRELLEGGTGRPTFLMSRGVDTSVFAPAKRGGGSPNRMVNIGYVGRLSVDRNVRLLRELEAALEDNFDVRFTIVGYGSEREWLRHHMQRVEFSGILRGDALAKAYAGMDIFAFPAETETSGTAVLEAMAFGVPVVAMDGGGPAFPAEAGRSAIVAWDPQSFIEGVRSLVRSREKREAMGAAARARALELTSWDRIFDDICHAYGTAISLAQEHRGSDRPAPRMMVSQPSA